MKTKKDYTEVLLLVFICLLSGCGFTYGQLTLWPVFLVFISIFISYVRKIVLLQKDTIFLFVVLSFCAIQQFVYDGNLTNYVSIFCTIISLFLCAKIIAHSFKSIFYNTFVIIAAVSLAFWLIDITPDGHKLLLDTAMSIPQWGVDILRENRELNNWSYGYHIFLYTVDETGIGLPRNYGPFWEPGRYVVFLEAALMINLYNNKAKLFSIKNIILIAAIVTTFSTSGYLAMGVIFIGYVFNKFGFSPKTILGTIIILILSLYVGQFEFMSDKILFLMEDERNSSRFTAISYHLPMIAQSPLLGYADRLSTVYNNIEISPNGWTYMFLQWGIPFSLFFVYLLYKGSKVYVGNNSIAQLFVVIVFLVHAFSQTIMSSPFYLVLYFFSFCSCSRPKMDEGICSN